MVKRLTAILILVLASVLHADFLGDHYKIDDYIILKANTGQFSTGGSYTATSVTYYIYKEDDVGELNTGGTAVSSEFDGKTGFYLTKVQLTTAAGYLSNKTYTVLWIGVVDGVTASKSDTFRIAGGVTVAAFDLATPEPIDNVYSGLVGVGTGANQIALTNGGVTVGTNNDKTE